MSSSVVILHVRVHAESLYLIERVEQLLVMLDLVLASSPLDLCVLKPTAFMHDHKILLCGSKFHCEYAKFHSNTARKDDEWGSLDCGPNFSAAVYPVKSFEVSSGNISFKSIEYRHGDAKQMPENSYSLNKASSSHLSQSKFLFSPTSALGRCQQDRTYQRTHGTNRANPSPPVSLVESAVQSQHHDGCDDYKSEQRVSHNPRFEIVEINCHKGILA